MMSRFLPLLPCLLLMLTSPFHATLRAQEVEGSQGEDSEELEERVDDLNRAYEELLDFTESLQEQLNALNGDMAGAGDEFFIPREAAQFEATGMSQSLGNIYTRPFLTTLGRNTYIGGYIDLEFTDPSGSANREFDQHRFVPFFYSDVTENIKVAAEIEYEHGHELEVEFAQIDFLITEAANLRAGIQLLPLGRLNAVHDSPIQDLTFRPLVNQYIIPTTLRDAGIGVYGDINDTFSYNVTVTNGFRGLANDPADPTTGISAIGPGSGLKNAAPQKDTLADPFSNQNDELAYTGRLAATPVLGTEFGVSFHKDTYDEDGDNDLEIFALDATIDGKAVDVLPDNVEFLAEYAAASIERDAYAKASGVAGDMDGYYGQVNVHFEPQFLDDFKADGTLDESAHFTFVTRYDSVHLDTYDVRRTTFGLNFRPNATMTVVKLDYQSNNDVGSNKGSNNANAWALSFASYF